MNRIVLSLGLVLLAGSAAFAQDASPSPSPAAAADATFANKAAVVGNAEVKLGELAQKQAADADVKAFGKRMVDDHTKAGQELTDLAGKKGITLPKDLDADHQKVYDDLSKLNGAEFDKSYMGHMVGGHHGAISDFETASTSAQDPDIKAWAAKTLPTLQDHLKQAQTVATKVGAPSSNASPAADASPAPADSHK